MRKVVLRGQHYTAGKSLRERYRVFLEIVSDYGLERLVDWHTANCCDKHFGDDLTDTEMEAVLLSCRDLCAFAILEGRRYH